MGNKLITQTEEGKQYISSDLGKTWKFFGDGGNIFNSGTNLILGSTEDLGILYSNNSGTYWNETNIKEGNYKILFAVGSFIFAGSFDDSGILKSNDDGITWETTEIGSGYWTRASVSENLYLIIGEGGYASVDPTSGEVSIVSISSSNLNSFNSVTSDGGASDSSDSSDEYDNYEVNRQNLRYTENIIVDGKLTDDRLHSLINYIINNVIKKDIYISKTGRTGLNVNSSFATNLTSQESKIVCSSDDVYRLYKSSSIIDWESDLGMEPFDGISVSDLINSNVVEEENIYDSVKGEDDKSLLQLISYIRNYINKRKSAYNSYVEGKIDDQTEDIEKIKSLTTDSSMLVSNIQAYKLYISSENNAAKILSSSLSEELFYFDDYMIELLIKNAVYETIIQVIGHIKFKLISLGQESEKDGFIKIYNPLKDDKLQYNFDKGLEIALNNYLEYVSNNIIKLNSSNDQNLINIAADYYKRYKREEYIQSVIVMLGETEIDFTNNYIRNYTKYDTDIKAFTESVKTIIESSSSSKRDEINSLLNSTSFSYYNIDYNKVMTDAYLELYLKLSSRMNNEIIFDYFSENTSSYESISTELEKDRARGYLTEIYEKFINRCKTLLGYSYENANYEDYAVLKIKVEDRQKKQIISWINSVLTDTGLELTKDFYDDNIPNVINILNEESNKFLNIIKAYFVSKEDII